MTIQTTWRQTAGAVETPQAGADEGCGPAGSGGGLGGGIGTSGCTSDDVATAGATGRAGATRTRVSRGAVTPPSRLDSTAGLAPLAMRASETAGLRVVREVTSTAVQRRAGSGPVCTARAPVRGALRGVHGPSEACRTVRPDDAPRNAYSQSTACTPGAGGAASVKRTKPTDRMRRLTTSRESAPWLTTGSRALT